MNNCIALTHNSTGAQTTGVLKRQFVVPRGTWRLRDVQARLNTAPAGSTFLIDINKNGTTIFTTQTDRTTVQAGANAAGAHKPQSGSFIGGDRLSYDIDQIGSGTAGSDLDVTFFLELN